jgi:hypothetical protein
LSLAFTRAERDNVPFVLFTRGPEIRLYAVSGYAGVGRKGQAETYVQANVALLGDDETGFLPLIFSADALLDGGTFGEVLEWSRDFSAALSVRLRERVYVDVVPGLAVAIADEHARHGDSGSLDEIYEETLIVLFRLLFLAYAEDRGLLPYATNAAYRRHSLKALARELAEHANANKGWADAGTTTAWATIGQLFEAVDRGNEAWGVPPYNGGLFSHDAGTSAAGAAIVKLRLTDAHFAPALEALLTEPDGNGVLGPVDFRSLSVRDFGTIYEGLLESSLSKATGDLTLDAKGTYLPATNGTEVIVRRGDIYFHNQSGARKSSGSYFTKDFPVEHLLEHALEPALDKHLARLDERLRHGEDDAAATLFFDFRCADIAMGSGHFLVAAVDRIERRLAQFLDEHPLPSVEAELDRLRASAVRQLGDSAVGYEIERRQLLRRQVARRCVYGVDRNVLAVDLARVSLWVHTFVPGLPLSFLDHNLVQGDSLTGIGTVGEAAEFLTGQSAGKKAKHGQGSVFEGLILEGLDQAKEPLRRLGRSSDATRTDLHETRTAAAEALERVEPVRRLFDLLAAQRRKEALPFSALVDDGAVAAHPDLATAEATARQLQALHFPIAFPEVFLRERPGFDCLLGNPPWDKLQVEEHTFYALHFPGLRGLGQAQAEAALADLREQRPDLAQDYADETATMQRTKTALARGPFPGLTSGRPDLFKAFAWRFWQLVRQEGIVGLVLPRKALEASGTADWRKTILTDGTFRDVTMLVNRGGWVFDDVHQQYTVGLLVAQSHAASPTTKTITLRGPFTSMSAYQQGVGTPAGVIKAQELLTWSDTATFPMVRDAAAMRTFLRMREHPRLDTPADGWEVRGLRELNATDDKHHFLFNGVPASVWPVFKASPSTSGSPTPGSTTRTPIPATSSTCSRRGARTRSAIGVQPSMPWAPNGRPTPRHCLAWRRGSRGATLRGQPTGAPSAWRSCRQRPSSSTRPTTCSGGAGRPVHKLTRSVCSARRRSIGSRVSWSRATSRSSSCAARPSLARLRATRAQPASPRSPPASPRSTHATRTSRRQRALRSARSPSTTDPRCWPSSTRTLLRSTDWTAPRSR